MHLSKHSKREKLILDFYQLQKLDPIVKVFSDRAFRIYVCFPYVKCNNPSGKSWVVEVLVAEELFSFPYPFQLPKSFLRSGSKNDLRLKVCLMKSLAVSDQNKRLEKSGKKKIPFDQKFNSFGYNPSDKIYPIA